MQFKLPKSDKYQWTQHAQYKMRQYGLSPQRVIRVIRNPERIEEGIAEKTIAVMQPASTRGDRSSTRGGPSSMKNKNGKKFWSQEIWAMYQTRRAGNPKSQIPSLDLRRPLVDARRANSKNPHPALSLLGRGGSEKIKIISAWRYPGVSPKNNPIPEEILQELAEIATS